MVDMQIAMTADPTLDPAAPTEPLLEIDEIQGNVLPGFMKPRMAVIAVRSGDLDRTRGWLAALVPEVTTLAQVMPSRLKVREERLRKGVTAGFTAAAAELDDCWLNISLSHRLIAMLLAGGTYAGDADKFADDGFRTGLATRSALLGDPTDPEADGHPTHWLFGGPSTAADALIVLGADRENSMAAFADRIRSEAVSAGLTILHEDHGGKLDRLGREHFGFQDGISQPGVRGRLPGEPETVLTPRTIEPATLPEHWLYGLPGQYLVWPGMFVFGYPTQGADPLLAAPAEVPGPAWSRNGSYAVYRRLRQDVAGFRAFTEEQAVALRSQGLTTMTGPRLQANLFGRWPSGAPLARTPDADDPKLGADPLANNHFDFAVDTPDLPLAGSDQPTSYLAAHADPVGLTCPHAAHIRKVNTRDVGSDQGGRRSSFQRRLLRRGLPFGPVLPDSGPDPVAGDRGLMFLSYQASIVDQFEFLANAWMNDPVAPRSPGGHDMVIGQNGQPGEDRVRRCVLIELPLIGEVTATRDSVIPTGGGYFFTPSVNALREVLSVAPPVS